MVWQGDGIDIRQYRAHGGAVEEIDPKIEPKGVYAEPEQKRGDEQYPQRGPVDTVVQAQKAAERERQQKPHERCGRINDPHLGGAEPLLFEQVWQIDNVDPHQNEIEKIERSDHHHGDAGSRGWDSRVHVPGRVLLGSSVVISAVWLSSSWGMR